MSEEGSKWTPGKIFLLIVGILVGLGAPCCGGVWFVPGVKIMSGIHFGKNSIAYVERLRKDYGPTALFGIEKDDRQNLVLTIGAGGELTPQRVVEVQGGAWKPLV